MGHRTHPRTHLPHGRPLGPVRWLRPPPRALRGHGPLDQQRPTARSLSGPEEIIKPMIDLQEKYQRRRWWRVPEPLDPGCRREPLVACLH